MTWEQLSLAVPIIIFSHKELVMKKNFLEIDNVHKPAFHTCEWPISSGEEILVIDTIAVVFNILLGMKDLEHWTNVHTDEGRGYRFVKQYPKFRH